MNKKYYLYLILFLLVLFKHNIINIINNLGKIMFNNSNTLEVTYLKNKNNLLYNEYNELLNFKNNIKINNNYTVTNAIYDNYSFNKLIINGDNYNLGDEVINEYGLIGYISKINKGNSEVTFLYNTSSAV